MADIAVCIRTLIDHAKWLSTVLISYLERFVLLSDTDTISYGVRQKVVEYSNVQLVCESHCFADAV